MKALPLTAAVVVLTLVPSVAQEYVAERFTYAGPALGSPWVVSNDGDGAGATISSAAELGGYRPDGGQVVFDRPSSSGGSSSAISATLDTGANAGTGAWTLAEGSRVRLRCHFAIGAIGNTQGFVLRLQQGGLRMASFRVYGLPSVGTATLQYAANGANDFVTVPGAAPVLEDGRWYLLDVTAQLGALTAGGDVRLDVVLYDMSDGGLA